MPTYQYACTNPDGKHEFEVVQSFSDAPVAECPQCGSPVRKIYGSVGVVFKGSGFYRTDSRNGASPAKAAAKGSESGSSAPAADSSSSGKPESSSAKSESSSTKSSSSTSSPSSSSSSAS